MKGFKLNQKWDTFSYQINEYYSKTEGLGEGCMQMNTYSAEENL